MTAIKDTQPPFSLEYNTIKIGEPTENQRTHYPHWSVSVTPIYADDGRTVAEVEYTLDLTTYVYGLSEVEEAEAMEVVTARLSEPNKTLVVNGIGFGGLSVEGSDIGTVGGGGRSFKKPTNFGVQPSRISCQPMGPACYEIAARFVFRLSPCDSPSGLLSLSYGVTWSFDHEGLGTRIINGSARVSDPVHIQNVRREMRFAIVLGFDRVNQTYSESPDKLTLSFTVVDVEYGDDIRPPGLTDYGFDFSARPLDPLNTQIVLVTLSARATTRPGIPKAQGLAIILSEVASHVAQMINAGLVSRDNYGRMITKAGMVLPLGMNVSRDTHGRSTRFVASFRTVIRSATHKFPSMPAMWHLENANADWAAYLGGAGNFYGATGLPGDFSGYGGINNPFGVHNNVTDFQSKYGTSTSTLHDPCKPIYQTLDGRKWEVVKNNRQHGEGDINVAFGCWVSKQNSIINYNALFKHVQDSATIPHYKNRYIPEQDPRNDMNTTHPDIGDQGDVSERDIVTERMGFAKSRIIVYGYMVRVHYAAFAPRYKTINGQRVKWIGDENVETSTIGKLFDCKINSVRYRQEYQVLGKMPKGGAVDTQLAEGEDLPAAPEALQEQDIKEFENRWWDDLDHTLESIRQ